MVDKQSDKQLDSFLSKVDEIGSIIKGLASLDESVNKPAIEKADALLDRLDLEEKKTKYGVDRSVINKDAFKDAPSMPASQQQQQQQDSMEPTAFMAAIEKDCQERAERKKELKKEAEKLKDEGNVEFSKGNYENAVALYKQATEKIKDWDILHTNLAQAHVRLGQFEAALEACTWAFRVNEKCLKAFILQGKAYFGLKQYEKAIDSYREAVQAFPEKESTINTYILQTKVAMESEAEEKSAMQVFNDGDSAAAGVVEVLTKLGQLPEKQLLFYSGGLRVARDLLKDVNSKTLLRMHGGLSLMKTHTAIARCFSALPDTLSEQEADVCLAYLELLQSACDDSDANKSEIIEQNDLIAGLLKCAESKRQREVYVDAVVLAALRLFHLISESECGRREILAQQDVVRLVSCFSRLLLADASFQYVIVAIINNFTLEKKFRVQVCSVAEEKLIPSLESLMERVESSAVVHASVNVLTNLALETYIRRKLASRSQTWKMCLNILMKFGKVEFECEPLEIISSVLGLLANMALERKGDDFSETGLELCIWCSRTLSEKRLKEDTGGGHAVLQRLCLLISRLLVANEDDYVDRCHSLIIPEILNIIQILGSDVITSGAACLAACTKSSEEARRLIVDTPKGLKTVLDLLKSDNESIVGNAALCLSHCAELPKVCKALAKTNIVMDLLVLARDKTKPTVQHNCAILIARLSQGDQRHLDRLRELHGHEILNTVLLHVKE